MVMERFTILMAALKKGDGSMGRRITRLLPIDCQKLINFPYFLKNF